MSALVTTRFCISARRRRYNIDRLHAAAIASRRNSNLDGGGEEEEEIDLEHGNPYAAYWQQGVGGSARELDQQQAGPIASTSPRPKLPAIVLHPDLSTVEFAIKEENNIHTQGQLNQQGAGSSSVAAPRTPPAIFSYNGYREFRRNNGYARRQQAMRRSAPPPALVTVDVDGTAAEETSISENVAEEEVEEEEQENIDETPAAGLSS